jgi:hypothetical protein
MWHCFCQGISFKKIILFLLQFKIFNEQINTFFQILWINIKQGSKSEIPLNQIVSEKSYVYIKCMNWWQSVVAFWFNWMNNASPSHYKNNTVRDLHCSFGSGVNHSIYTWTVSSLLNIVYRPFGQSIIYCKPHSAQVRKEPNQRVAKGNCIYNVHIFQI